MSSQPDTPLPNWERNFTVGPKRAALDRARQPLQVRNHRILIADDYPDTALALATVFESWGHKVDVCHKPREVLLVTDHIEHDYAFLDMSLCELQGFSVCRHLRSKDVKEPMCIFAVTGWHRSTDIALAKEVGYDGYLLKPVEMNTLARVLSGEDLPFFVSSTWELSAEQR